jgi:hypothetical protein
LLTSESAPLGPTRRQVAPSGIRLSSGPVGADLVVGPGAEVGSTAGITSLGQTKVLKTAAGMKIDFTRVTTATTLTEAENAAVNAMGGPGVAYSNRGGNEYFIATDHTETAISSQDAIVKLVGVIDLQATSIDGLVRLHV